MRETENVEKAAKALMKPYDKSANLAQTLLISELKSKVAQEMKTVDNSLRVRLAKTIYETVIAHCPPEKGKEHDQKLELQGTSNSLAASLVDARNAPTNGTAEEKTAAALKLFNDNLDKVSPALPVSRGTLLGAGAGLIAALNMGDANDWSFSGILKKLALVAVGVAAGGFFSGDAQALLPHKPADKAKAAGK